MLRTPCHPARRAQAHVETQYLASPRVRPGLAGATCLLPDVSTALRFARHDKGRLAAFTLIELLVVISVIALLISILLPSLQRVRKQARAVGCQSNLHQWGLAFNVYTSDNDGKFYRVNLTFWLGPMKRWWVEDRRILLCPMAFKSSPAIVGPEGGPVPSEGGRGSTFSAWKMSGSYANLLNLSSPLLGSYGVNDSVIDPIVPDRTEPLSETSVELNRRQWVTAVAREAANVPVLVDCVVASGVGGEFQTPPPCENVWPPQTLMDCFCINRHEGGVNCLFMDWSVRKVGLKELWTLNWYRGCSTTGPWTTAGAVKPEDWPQWMRRFKDY